MLFKCSTLINLSDLNGRLLSCFFFGGKRWGGGLYTYFSTQLTSIVKLVQSIQLVIDWNIFKYLYVVITLIRRKKTGRNYTDFGFVRVYIENLIQNLNLHFNPFEEEFLFFIPFNSTIHENWYIFSFVRLR